MPARHRQTIAQTIEHFQTRIGPGTHLLNFRTETVLANRTEKSSDSSKRRTESGTLSCWSFGGGRTGCQNGRGVLLLHYSEGWIWWRHRRGWNKTILFGERGGDKRKKRAKNGFFSPRLGDHFFTVPHYNLFCVFPIMFLQSYNRKSKSKKKKMWGMINFPECSLKKNY